MPFNSSGGFNGPPPGQPAASGGMGIPFGGTLGATGTGIPLGGGAAGTTSAAAAAVYPDTVVIGGVVLMAGVAKGTRAGLDTHFNEHGGRPEGRAVYNVTFAADPAVDYADVAITWTATASGPLRAPVVLASLGAAEPPGAGTTGWIVAAERRS